MGVLISSDDFKGRFAIPQSTVQVGKLDAFINDTEENYLNDLMGAILYADFKSNLTNPGPPPTTATNKSKPTNAGYLAIYNSFNADYGSKLYRSKGMVAMLLGFIFFDYMRQVKFKTTEKGIIVNGVDTGNPVVIGNLYSYLNDATETYQAIQTYIQNIHPEQFSTTIVYNGQEKQFGISSFE